jgi:hypothetical protein
VKIRRPSAGVVVGIIAIVIAMSGSAVAASLITSKQIKDGTIQLVDISKQARSVLKGATGPAGLQGPKGDTGPQGPKGDTGTVDTSNFFTKAQSDARYRAPLGTTVSLPGVAFHPLGGTAALAERYFNIGAVNPAAGTSPTFYASLPVPQGATITSLSFNGLDNDPVNDITVTIGGTEDNAVGDGSISAGVSSSGQNAAYQTFTANVSPGAVVDATTSAPWVQIKFDGDGANTTLVVARVSVTYTLPG